MWFCPHDYLLNMGGNSLTCLPQDRYQTEEEMFLNVSDEWILADIEEGTAQ
jgi:hypothetical protein